jgi:coproporphyrinogen III oxidase-like Fe-S oxidoreductase
VYTNARSHTRPPASTARVYPSATSYVSAKDFRAAVKTLNPTSADGYTRAVDAGGRVWDKAFVYTPQDQRLFWLVRRLAALAIDTREYLALFGTQLAHDFGEAFRACHAAGLLGEVDHVIRPTPLGMFYSDSIAAVLARTVVRDADGRRPVPKELVHDARQFDASHSSMG